MSTNETSVETLAETVVVKPKILYFGTSVVLVGTTNEDGTPNLAPMSSAWALGDSIVLGLISVGQTIENLQRTGECTLNHPSPEHWEMVERIGSLTARQPVPAWLESKNFVSSREKFEISGFTPIPSEIVAPPRAAECRLQIEAKLEGVLPLQAEMGGAEGGAVAAAVRAVRVHAGCGALMRGFGHEPRLRGQNPPETTNICRYLGHLERPS